MKCVSGGLETLRLETSQVSLKYHTVPFQSVIQVCSFSEVKCFALSVCHSSVQFLRSEMFQVKHPVLGWNVSGLKFFVVTRSNMIVGVLACGQLKAHGCLDVSWA